MQIDAPCVVSLSWRLEDAHGQLIDELVEPVEFFVGGDDLLNKVEEALIGHEAGFEASLHLEPEHAFGDYDPALVFFEERSAFSGHIEAGMQFDGVPEGATTQGMSNEVVYTVTEAFDTHVVFDGNHPLAGIALVLALKVRDVRAASEVEIEHGSVAQQTVTVLSTAPPSTQLH
ncbi:MAG: peptidylprolyl isomerase [Methylibium sp.]|uniref:FKBP-type peptidyl-prolyl cis-trans isomerase n=1 Tax=Methylibium sp. TaxID=2067992 RepID=UPI0017D2F2E9|nr:peptidylprolyl isomerase [Methylibium sp.]MBA3597458.1 peptidylprolyl isomerase [Methylibium sp.]